MLTGHTKIRIMTDESAWRVVLYRDAQGNRPVREFLQSLDLKTQARFDWSIEQLRLLNVSAREPLVKHLEAKILELRRASDGNIYRVLYFFFPDVELSLYTGSKRKRTRLHAATLRLQS